jgi:hypothetical protein
VVRGLPPDQDQWLRGLQARLLAGEPAVAALFAVDPFAGRAPRHVRVLACRFTFASAAERRAGVVWRRELLGVRLPSPAAGRRPRLRRHRVCLRRAAPPCATRRNTAMGPIASHESPCADAGVGRTSHGADPPATGRSLLVPALAELGMRSLLPLVVCGLLLGTLAYGPFGLLVAAALWWRVLQRLR